MNYDGVCADYLLGYLYSCPDFPDPEDIYEAPSVCLEQYLEVIMKLKMGQKPVNPEVIASGEYSEYCYTNCYQVYVDRAEEYIEECSQYIASNFTAISESLNAFRGISCGETNYTVQENENCYDQLQDMTGGSDGSPSPLSDFTCTLYDPAMYPQVCTQFSANGCCFGNQAVMLGQSLMNPIPPCLNRYCVDIAPTTDLCGRHINFATGNIKGSVYLDFAPPALPNMYNNETVLIFQAGLMGPLGLLPTKVAIFDFTYFNNGVPITDNSPSGYTSATSGNFSYLITLVQTTEAELAEVSSTLSSPTYAGALQQQVFQNAGTVTVAVGADRYYPSDQIQTSGARNVSPLSMGLFFFVWVLSLQLFFS